MKKVLIVTYYFPPAGGPGVQRWLKFVKYLPEFGIQPIVYIPENPTYPIIDNIMTKQVPDDLVIVRRRIFEPYHLASLFSEKKTRKFSSGIIPNQKKQSFPAKFLLWVRGNLFIPDARVLWVGPSVSFLKKYLAENDIDTIITSGPPHSLHLIGLHLRNRMDVRWIADFRDPWTTIGYHKSLRLSAYAEKRHKMLEHRVLNGADLILVTSKSTKAEFAQLTQKPIEIITNGYDSDKSLTPVMDKKFSLAHIGSFLSRRNPDILWQSLQELASESREFASDLELKLIGAVSAEIVDTLTKFSLAKYVNKPGYVPHQEAIAHQRKSQVLLLIEINSEETKSIIPAKLFEYMVSGRPIIAIGPAGSDFAEIINDTHTGAFFQYGEKDRLKAQIWDYYNLYRSGALKTEPVGLAQYSRKNLTSQLAQLLSETRHA